MNVLHPDLILPPDTTQDSTRIDGGKPKRNQSLRSQLKVDNFSYCSTNITSTSSPVLLGLPANLSGGASSGAAVQTTPLNTTSTFYYYLNMKSITVGSTTLQVPASAFALNADGTGGTIIDSGTSITSLPPHVFSLLRDAFVSQLNMTPVAVTSLPDVLCFPASTQTTTMPKLQLQFKGATLNLPRENYVFPQDNNTCIAILQSSGGNNMTIIGTYQRQNLHVLYDLAGDTLSFVPAQCDKGSVSASPTVI
ncbi:aspartic proteinase nepenthesin-2-like [Miscanthus floridulus]|uniref:aspartic proteinase nepenthesin-2-like n=1 Tax=Miscanthus floridulus TaxID=154761 RepID=UPI00345754C5